jgi:hypothetical protein
MHRLLFTFALLVTGLRAEIQFAGFFVTTQDARFTLSDTTDGRSSGWLRIGQSFRDHRVVSFDRQREVLTLEYDGATREVPLRTARIKAGKATVAGRITFPGGQLDGVYASLFLWEETAFPLRDGATLFLLPEGRPDGSVLYRARFVLRQPDGSDDVVTAPAVIARAGSSFGVQMGEMGFTFQP